MSHHLLCVGGPKHGQILPIDSTVRQPIVVLEERPSAAHYRVDADLNFMPDLMRTANYWTHNVRVRIDVKGSRTEEFDVINRLVLVHEPDRFKPKEELDALVKDAVFRMWMLDEPFMAMRYDHWGYPRQQLAP